MSGAANPSAAGDDKPSILGAAEFPFDQSDGKTLLALLARLYPSPPTARVILEKAGFKRVFNQDDPQVLWHAALTHGAANGLNRALAKCVQDDLGERSPHHPFLTALLAGEPDPAEFEEALINYRKSRREAFDFREEPTTPAGG